MFITLSFVIVPNCPSVVIWINTQWNSYAVKGGSAVKMNEPQLYAMTWMDLINIIVRERRQTEKHILLHKLIFF